MRDGLLGLEQTLGGDAADLRVRNVYVGGPGLDERGDGRDGRRPRGRGGEARSGGGRRRGLQIRGTYVREMIAIDRGQERQMQIWIGIGHPARDNKRSVCADRSEPRPVHDRTHTESSPVDQRARIDPHLARGDGLLHVICDNTALGARADDAAERDPGLLGELLGVRGSDDAGS